MRQHSSLATAFTIAFASLASAQSPLDDFDLYGNGSYSLEIGGQPVTLQLEAHEVRAPDFYVAVAQADGTMEHIPVHPARTVRGHVSSWPSLVVVGSLTPDGAELMATDAVTGQAWEIHSDATFSAMVAGPASQQSSASSSVRVSVPGMDADSESFAGTAAAGSVPRVIEVLIETDTEFLALQGNNVTAAVAYAEDVLNRTSFNFEQAANVELSLTGVVLRPFNQPWTSTNPTALRNALNTYWAPRRDRSDLTHLLTGKVLDGGALGAAYQGNYVCQGRGVGVTSTRYAVDMVRAIMAHHLAHNLNQGDCTGAPDCRIMCNPPGGCLPPTAFSQSVANSISAVVQGQNCLQPRNLLPLDITDSSTIGNSSIFDRNLWQSIFAAEVVTAVGPSRSIRLGKVSSFAGFSFGEVPLPSYITTGDIDMGTVLSAELKFKLWAIPFPSNPVVEMEYRSQSGDWIPFYLAPTSAMNSGLDITRQLPSGAVHGRAAIRIRNRQLLADRFVYVKDVHITGQPCTTSTSTFCDPPAGNSVSPAGSTIEATGGFSLTNDLILTCTNLPANQFGQYVMTGDLHQNPPAFGDGMQCVRANPLVRFTPMSLTGNPTAWRSISPSTLIGAGVMAGDTMHFQFFYRDQVGLGANASSGISIQFCF